MLHENEDSNQCELPRQSRAADKQPDMKEDAVRAMIVAIMEWMQAQRADKRLRQQHAKLQEKERGGRGAPCVRCDESANARAHVARWHDLPRALGSGREASALVVPSLLERKRRSSSHERPRSLLLTFPFVSYCFFTSRSFEGEIPLDPQSLCEMLSPEGTPIAFLRGYDAHTCQRH